MYKDLYDDNHKLLFKSNKNSSEYTKKSSGVHEGGLLCQNCDNHIIGKYESYARDVLYGSPRVRVNVQKFKNQEGVLYSKVEGVDYKKFKLFLLSILWRASISKNEFFHRVDLGQYEETIRKMIINEDPGHEKAFPFMFMHYMKENVPKDFITSPEQGIMWDDGVTTFWFPICGILYFFRLTEDEQSDFIMESTIRSDNELKILDLPDKHVQPFLRSMFE